MRGCAVERCGERQTINKRRVARWDSSHAPKRIERERGASGTAGAAAAIDLESRPKFTIGAAQRDGGGAGSRQVYNGRGVTIRFEAV